MNGCIKIKKSFCPQIKGKRIIKRGVPRQWFTGAIIMKKFMCNEEHYNVIALFFRTNLRITVKYE